MPKKIKLTKTSVEALSAPAAGQLLVWDTDLPGFGIRITAGDVRSFILQRRINGRDRRMKLGRFGELTCDEARKLALKTLGKIADGKDPIAEKARKQAQSVTLEKALDRYLETRKNLKPSTVTSMRQTIERAFPEWLSRPLTKIGVDTVLRRHAELGESGQAYANLAMRYLRAVFNHSMEAYRDAEGLPVITANPVTAIGKQRAWFRVERRRTFIKPHELEPWFKAVLALEHEEARDYFLLLILTGLRRSEGLGLRWDGVDLKGRTLTVRDTKNGETHTLPLSDYLLDMLKRRAAHKYGEYVFSGPLGRFQNLRYSKTAVRKRSGVSFTPHDLRRTFATVADSLDVPAYAVKALLNHKNGADVTSGYIVHDVERLRAPMQKITDYMLKAAKVRHGAEIIKGKFNTKESRQ
jgi:integrase